MCIRDSPCASSSYAYVVTNWSCPCVCVWDRTRPSRSYVHRNSRSDVYKRQTQTTIDAQTGDVKYQSAYTQTYTDRPDGSYTVQQSDEELMTEVVDEYDAAGNLISRRIIWDSDGRTTDYDYTLSLIHIWG